MKVKILKTIPSLNNALELEAGVLYEVPFVKTNKQTKKQYGLDFQNTHKNDYGYELVFWTDNIGRSRQYLQPEIDFIIIDSSKKEAFKQEAMF